MSRPRNNFRAGLFVLTGIVLGFVVIVVMADFSSFFVEMQRIHVRYNLLDGLQGLKNGATVTVGSVPAGNVLAITDEMDDQGVVISKRVTFEIPAKYKLYDNSVIELVVPPLGSGTSLNIESFGRDLGNRTGFVGKSWEYEPGDVLFGGIAGSLLTASLAKDVGIEETQRRQIQQIIAQVNDITRDVSKVTAHVAEDPEQVTRILGHVEQISAALEEDVPQITADLKLIIADVNKHREQWFAQVTSVLKDAKAAMATAHTILLENKDDLRNTVASAKRAVNNAEDLTETARDETMKKVHAALDQAREAVADVKRITANVDALLTSQRPVLERSMANLRLTSDQLKLAAIEIRRSPWRLLYSPTDRELETNNVYDAARSFALAAGALDSTAESLRVLVEKHPNATDVDRENLKLMLQNLHETFEKFANVEDRFWEAVDTMPASE